MNREIEARLKISAVDRTERAFQSVSRRFNHVERQAQAYNRAERQAAAFRRTEAAASGALLTNARLLGGAAVAAGVTQTVRAFSSYEDALVEIQKKGGFTADQIAKVGQEARDLSTSGELAVPLEEILSAYERGAAAGIPIEELREFAVLSTRASDAFEMAAEDTSNAIAGWKTNLQMTNPEIERMLDLVNGLADSGISDESDILSFMSRSGPALQNIGFANEQIAALGATMLNLQIEWETASRGINSATSSILAPQSKGAQERLLAMFAPRGGFQAFRQRFLKDGAAGLQEFMDVVSEMDDLEQLDTLVDIVGKEFGPQFQRLIAGSAELKRNMLYADNQEGWFGSLTESYQLKLGTLSSQWQVFKNQVGELAIDVGSMGLPTLQSGLGGAKTIVEQIDQGLKAFSEGLDTGAFEDAKNAIFGVRDSVGELSAMEVNQDGEIVQFFKQLATVSNGVAATIETIGNGIDLLSDPFGLKAKAGGDEQNVWDPFGWGADMFSIKTTKGSVADWYANHLSAAGDTLGSFAGWANDRNQAAITARSPEGRAAARADQLENADPYLGIPALGLRVGPFVGGDQELADAAEARWQSMIDAYEAGPTIPAAPEARPELGDADPFSALPMVGDDAISDFEILSGGFEDSLQAGAVSLAEAGTQAGTSIETSGAIAGQAFSETAGAALASDASAAGANFGRAAAAAFNAGVRLPTGAMAPPRPNANLGRSMPDVGTPGL